jgi:predicted HAD superfamily phosphohydrolase YqeG
MAGHPTRLSVTFCHEARRNCLLRPSELITDYFAAERKDYRTFLVAPFVQRDHFVTYNALFPVVESDYLAEKPTTDLNQLIPNRKGDERIGSESQTVEKDPDRDEKLDYTKN